MLRIRIIAVVAVTIMTSFLAAHGARAQTASGEQPDKPLLIQLIAKENAATAGQADNPTASVSTTTVRKIRRRRFARRRHRETAREIDQGPDRAAPSPDPMGSNASADDSPPANATPAGATPASTTAPMTETDHVQQDDAPLPSAVVVDGRTVAIAASDQINALDLAADNSPPTESTLSRGDHADVAAAGANPLQAAFAVQTPVATNQKTDNATSAAPTTDPQSASAQAMSAQDISAQDVIAQSVSDQDASDQITSNQNASDQKAERQDSSAAGSLAWIAQAFAALGGAVAAGVVAWFLIGGGPVRSYN
jgi:hypothetical protein